MGGTAAAILSNSPSDGSGHGRLAAGFGNIGQRAQRGHVARTELPPIGQHRRERGADLVDAQTQQSVPRPAPERPLQPRAARGFQRQRQRLTGLAEGEHAVRE